MASFLKSCGKSAKYIFDPIVLSSVALTVIGTASASQVAQRYGHTFMRLGTQTLSQNLILAGTIGAIYGLTTWFFQSFCMHYFDDFSTGWHRYAVQLTLGVASVALNHLATNVYGIGLTRIGAMTAPAISYLMMEAGIRYLIRRNNNF